MASRPDPNKQNLPLRTGPPQVQRPKPPTANPQNANQSKPAGTPPVKPARKYEWSSDTPNDIRSVAHATIELAVKLLKTPPSRKHLVSEGLEVITTFGAGQHKCPPDTDERKMQGLLTFYLNSLDTEFLKIEYSRIQGGAAIFTPASWYNPTTTTTTTTTTPTKSLRDWRPPSGGTLSLAESVFRPLATSREARKKQQQQQQQQDDPLLQQKHDEAYTRLQFAAATTIAAHLATCFVAFLTGGPGASAKFARECRSLDHGARGYEWQRGVLGGEVTTREEHRMHPLRAGQGGTVWLLDEKNFARRVDEECVRRVVGYDFVLPLVTSKEQVYIEELPKTMEGVRAASQAWIVYGKPRAKRPEAGRTPSNSTPSSSASNTASSDSTPPRRRPTQTTQGTD